MTQDALDVTAPELDVHTGLTEDARKSVADMLGVVLADSYQLMIKTQGVHWNVAGPAFYSIHKLTEEHYANLFEAIDETAERIRALGRKAPASYTKFGQLSAIKDRDEPQSAGKMIEMLVADHETVARSLRDTLEQAEEQRDHVTSDMLVARLAWHEKAIWMLRALDADGTDVTNYPTTGGLHS
jgi:starvation-inducible DNA-binding protein